MADLASAAGAAAAGSWLGPLGTIGGAAAGGLLGLFTAKAEREAALRREQTNAKLGSLDTLYSPFLDSKAPQIGATEPGMNPYGALAAGTLSGIQQVGAFREAGAKKNYYEELAKKLGTKDSGVQILAGQPNAYAGMLS